MTWPIQRLGSQDVQSSINDCGTWGSAARAHFSEQLSQVLGSQDVCESGPMLVGGNIMATFRRDCITGWETLTMWGDCMTGWETLTKWRHFKLTCQIVVSALLGNLSACSDDPQESTATVRTAHAMLITFIFPFEHHVSSQSQIVEDIQIKVCAVLATLLIEWCSAVGGSVFNRSIAAILSWSEHCTAALFLQGSKIYNDWSLVCCTDYY